MTEKINYYRECKNCHKYFWIHKGENKPQIKMACYTCLNKELSKAKEEIRDKDDLVTMGLDRIEELEKQLDEIRRKLIEWASAKDKVITYKKIDELFKTKGGNNDWK